MMNKDILNAESGKDLVLDYIKRELCYKWKNVQPINKGRYWLVEGKSINPNIVIIYKRDWFYKFGDFAREKHWVTQDGKEETGIGDSINVKDLRTMRLHEIEDIYIIYRTGEIYTIKFHEFLCNSHSWSNKEGKEVRSISIHCLRRVNKNE